MNFFPTLKLSERFNCLVQRMTSGNRCAILNLFTISVLGLDENTNYQSTTTLLSEASSICRQLEQLSITL